MPYYDFECKECESSFEKKLAISEKEQGVTCPSCGSAAVAQIFKTLAFTGVGASTQPRSNQAMPWSQSGPCGGSCACFPNE